MAYTRNVGKYQLSRTIGEGTFAKVKLAKNLTSGEMVAIKVIDKQMVIQNNFMYQVLREIRTMKLLNHPNIVRIHEVIGTKTKIYIVMEYVAGGQLSDKLCYQTKLNEEEARKFFQQLIDAIDYCHSKGVYHRDLKPENLLLDSKGNLKISDFGLSTLQKPGSLLLTACGSPCYVAPELLKNKHYDGAAADVWACGVIFFELLAGYLPFDDRNLLSLYRRICRAEYKCPRWFTASHEKLLGKIFNPLPEKRIRIPEIIEDEWFQIDYKPAVEGNFEGKDSASDNQPTSNSKEVMSEDKIAPITPRFINAFELIAIASDLGLSGLFEEQDDTKRIMLGSRYAIDETIRLIEVTAEVASLSVERMNESKIKMQLKLKLKSRSCSNLLAEVTELAPTDCVVKISKSAGALAIYQEFCQSLSSVLTEEADGSLTRQRPIDDNITRIEEETKKRFATDQLNNRIIDLKSMLIKHSRHAGVKFLSSEGCCQHGENVETHVPDAVLVRY